MGTLGQILQQSIQTLLRYLNKKAKNVNFVVALDGLDIWEPRMSWMDGKTANRIHPLDACTNLHGNPLHTCWDISVCTKVLNQQIDTVTPLSWIETFGHMGVAWHSTPFNLRGFFSKKIQSVHKCKKVTTLNIWCKINGEVWCHEESSKWTLSLFSYK